MERTRADLFKEILLKEERSLTAKEIAELTEKSFPDFFEEKSQGVKNQLRHLDKIFSKEDLRQAAIQQIAAEVSSTLKGVAEREKDADKYGHNRWVYFLLENELSVIERPVFHPHSDNISFNDVKRDEASLYPLLIEYWKSSGDIRAYRIDEKRASNSYGREGNKWLFPDIVGFKRLRPEEGIDFHIGEMMLKAGLPRVEFYSVEVKKHITRSSVRADYFQAVSNSTWANKGYLAAACIDEAALMELKMLNQMHGIGVILLNSENFKKSEEIISPLRRAGVGAEMMGRLVEENADFKKFIEEVGKSFW